jgi:hypothetical protein
MATKLFRYTPRNDVFDAVNIHFGLYPEALLRTWERPGSNARAVAQRILELAYQPETPVWVELDPDPEDDWQAQTRWHHGVRRIIGPENLQEMVGDDPMDASSMLWKKEEVTPSKEKVEAE